MKGRSAVCPGSKWVGRDAWLQALNDTVSVFGRNNVMTAFVGGLSLREHGMTPDAALRSAIGLGYLIPRGIQPLYSLYWRTTGQNRGNQSTHCPCSCELMKPWRRSGGEKSCQ